VLVDPFLDLLQVALQYFRREILNKALGNVGVLVSSPFLQARRTAIPNEQAIEIDI
jgi:hypothetical protein